MIRPASPPPARPWLLADIGGTNARFGWMAVDSEEIQHVATLRGAAYAGPAAAAQAYLVQLQQTLGAAYRPPVAGAFAVATAVGGDHIAFTNSGWAFSCAAVERELALQPLLILNDFEALALSLPRLKAHQLRAWSGTAAGSLPGTLAVIGPGTGLGVAGLVPTAHGFVAVPGEGGHATLAAADDFESDLLAAARREHPHVSAERLLSGIGLPVLHAAVGAVLGTPVPPAAPGAPALNAGDIVERGLAGGDAVCSQTLDSFCALLGSFAGNVALTLGARGGVYIGGGIVPRLGRRFAELPFREHFEDKGRFRAYLEAIPTWVITAEAPALVGAARALDADT